MVESWRIMERVLNLSIWNSGLSGQVGACKEIWKRKVHLSNKMKSQRRSLCISLWEAVPPLQVLPLWDSSQASGGTPGVVIPEDEKMSWIQSQEHECKWNPVSSSVIVLHLTAMAFQVQWFSFTSAFQISWKFLFWPT